MSSQTKSVPTLREYELDPEEAQNQINAVRDEILGVLEEFADDGFSADCIEYGTQDAVRALYDTREHVDEDQE